MKKRNLILAAAVGAALGLPVSAQAEIEWFGNVYAKFLDGDRAIHGALYNNVVDAPGERGGDQGQGIEFELMFRSVVSSQVEIGGRIKARFNQNFWTNFGGFGRYEDDPKSNQYIKLRGAYAIITPGYDWIDSATIGSNDFGMFDPMTQGKYRYIDRDNASGFLFQGSLLDGDLRWDIARVSLPALFAGPKFFTTSDPNDPAVRYEAADGAWTGQLRWTPTPDFNASTSVTYVRDKEVAPDEFIPGTEPGSGDIRDGTDEVTRFDNTVFMLKGEYTGFDVFDLSAAYYWSDFNVDPTICDPAIDPAGSCAFSPTLLDEADDFSYFVNLDISDFLIENLTFNIQAFHVGADYMSIQSARREADVLLTAGWMSTWGWARPDYNVGDRRNTDQRNGIGYGGWNGEQQQVVSLMADNDFTDFDEPMAYDVHGWKGFTVVPKYSIGDWEFAAEVTYVDYDTNWQNCGNVNDANACDKYAFNENTNAWGLGGDHRSPYSAYQDRETWFYGIKANYFLDLGNGVDVELMYRFIEDEDNRVTSEDSLLVAYAGSSLNEDWIPNPGLGGCVGCDDRKAEYSQYGVAFGYQLHPDLYGKIILERYEVDLIDGTTDVAPVGALYRWQEYLTGEHTKDRLGLEFNYFLSGVEFGAAIDWFWGEFTPDFYTDQNGRRVRLNPAGDFVATPLGNIQTSKVDLEHYRLKAFMKVSF